MRPISDYLFFGSIILLVITFVWNGSGVRGMVNVGYTDNGGASITDANRNQQEIRRTIQEEDHAVYRLLKSYLFWLSIAGMAGSYALTFV